MSGMKANGHEIGPKADLRGADLKGACLSGADLSGAIFVDGWVIQRKEVSDA